MMDMNNRIGNLKRKLAANKAKLGDRGTPQPQQSGGRTKAKARTKARSVTGEDEPSGAGSSKDGMEIGAGGWALGAARVLDGGHDRFGAPSEAPRDIGHKESDRHNAGQRSVPFGCCAESRSFRFQGNRYLHMACVAGLVQLCDPVGAPCSHDPVAPVMRSSGPPVLGRPGCTSARSHLHRSVSATQWASALRSRRPPRTAPRPRACASLSITQELPEQPTHRPFGATRQPS